MSFSFPSSAKIFLATALAFLVPHTVRAVPSAAYHLTFDEEFNSLNMWNGDTIWSGTNGGMWKPFDPLNSYNPWCLSYEAELYVSPTLNGFNGGSALGLNPFSTSNGVLSITGQVAPSMDLAALYNPADYLHSAKTPAPYQYSFTSGMLTSVKKTSSDGFTQTCGYFEMRAQLPAGAGLWPAFWLLPEAVAPFTNWTSEIDVLEAFGKQANQGGGANLVSETFHGTGGSQNWETIPGSIYAGYHTYGVNWETDYITFYVDGIQYYQVATPSGYTTPMMMLVNLALGTSSSWPGPVDPSVLPAKMNIDYIRVYSLNPSIPAVTPQTGYDPTTAGIPNFASVTSPAVAAPILLAGAAPGVVTLSTQGSADWSHWGGTSANNTLVWDHKSGVGTAIISNYSPTGGGSPVAYGSNQTAFDWTGSAGPDATCTDTAGYGTGISLSTLNGGAYFSVTTGIVPRILSVYVGANYAGGQLQIFNSSWNTLYSDTSVNDSTGSGANTVYTVDLPANATYYFQWTKVSGSGSVTLQGAAASSGPNICGLATGLYNLTPSTLTSYRMDAYTSGGAGTKVDMNTAVPSSSEVWQLTNLGGNLYEISPSYNTALAVTTSGSANGSALTIATYTGASAQQWILNANVDGSFALSPLIAGTQLASAPNNGTSGTQLVTSTTNSIYAQSWVITGTAAAVAPTVSVASGLSSVLQFNITVASTTPSATIYYTTDGSTPTTSSLSVASGDTITIAKSETLNAVALASGYSLSPVTSATYEVTGALACGDSNTLALKSNGTVYIWGSYGTSSPAQVTALSGITGVSSGHGNQFAVDNTNNLWAWGSNSFGQFGNGNTTSNTTPTKITGWGTSIAQVAAGEYHTVVLHTDNTVWAAGSGSSGQLGNGGTANSYMPVQVMVNSTTALSGVIFVGAGSYDSYAVKSDGTVWAWGRNPEGEIGNGSTTNALYATAVKTSSSTYLTGVIRVTGGAYHAVALTSSGTVYAWGANYDQQIGDGTSTQRNYATLITAFNGLFMTGLSVSPGGYHSVVSEDNGSVWDWGLNTSGQLGIGTSVNPSGDVPVQVLASGGVNFANGVVVAAGGYFTEASQANGDVWGWGANGSGQLGNGSTTSSPVVYPIQATSSFLLAVLRDWSHLMNLHLLFADQKPSPSAAKVSGS